MQLITKSVFALLAYISVAQAATCTVASTSGGDDTPNIVAAFNKCNNGGTVSFAKGTTYNMKSVVTLTGLKDVTVSFQGTVNLPAYDTKFEDEKAFFYLAGDNIQWSGSGTFNGNGQGWYDAVNRNAPPLFKPKAVSKLSRGQRGTGLAKHIFLRQTRGLLASVSNRLPEAILA